MRAIVTATLLLASLVPFAPGAAALYCTIQPYPDCEVRAGPVSAGAWVDTQWWPLEGEFYYCVDVEEPPVTRILCQHYVLA